jgi:BirA family biotin operon repressor/biotin-[acetyl-CoA-carboxylase] ligase
LKIIKINAIDSTNSYLKDLNKNAPVEDALVVIAKRQTNGRGQMGANWQSHEGKSLTFSVFKRFSKLTISDQSKVTFAVAVAIKRALEKFNIPEVSIKWPNDIMSYQMKIGGILIENQTKRDRLFTSIIGVGINVNETSFEDLPTATSMRLSTGVSYNIEEVFQKICDCIFEQLDLIEQKENSNLKDRYESSLFRKDIVSVFEDANGQKFNGIIRGVTESGELVLETELGTQVKYLLKQIKMLL